MRLILMGTGPFAVPSFRALQQNGHEIVHVVTRPVVKTGKKDAPPSPVRMWALESQLPLADPASINDPSCIEWLSSLKADLAFVCDYGQILSNDALTATRLGGINLHGSLLPRHRGAAPVQWSILAGDATAGVTTIHMTPALDGGPVLHRVSTPIVPDEDAAQLERRLSELGVSISLSSVKLLENKSSWHECSELGEKQDKALATKAPRLAKEDGELNCHYPVRFLDRLIRGLQPWPGTFASLEFPDGKQLRVIIPRANPIECDLDSLKIAPGEMLFGTRLDPLRATVPGLAHGVLFVAATDGLLSIPTIQPSGKRLMSAEEFLRGYSRFSSLRLSATPGSHRLLNSMSQIPK